MKLDDSGDFRPERAGELNLTLFRVHSLTIPSFSDLDEVSEEALALSRVHVERLTSTRIEVR